MDVLGVLWSVVKSKIYMTSRVEAALYTGDLVDETHMV